MRAGSPPGPMRTGRPLRPVLFACALALVAAGPAPSAAIAASSLATTSAAPAGATFPLVAKARNGAAQLVLLDANGSTLASATPGSLGGTSWMAFRVTWTGSSGAVAFAVDRDRNSTYAASEQTTATVSGLIGQSFRYLRLYVTADASSQAEVDSLVVNGTPPAPAGRSRTARRRHTSTAVPRPRGRSPAGCAFRASAARPSRRGSSWRSASPTRRRRPRPARSPRRRPRAAARRCRGRRRATRRASPPTASRATVPCSRPSAARRPRTPAPPRAAAPTASSPSTTPATPRPPPPPRSSSTARRAGGHRPGRDARCRHRGAGLDADRRRLDLHGAPRRHHDRHHVVQPPTPTTATRPRARTRTPSRRWTRPATPPPLRTPWRS